MDLDKFTQQIEQMRQRSQTFIQHAEQLASPQNLFAETLADLSTALEELHVAEEELREQNEQLVNARFMVDEERRRYQELFDFAPDGYLVTDPDGKINEANHAAVNLLKVAYKFLKGKPLSNFIPLEERFAFRASLTQLNNIERMQEWEIRVQPRHGDSFDCSISVTTMRDRTGNAVGYRWLLRDITARKKAEAQLRSIQLQNLQLQEASRIKSQFMAVLSHELRTPMNTILGFSQLLLRRYYQLFPPELRNMIERIINSGKQLLALIENLLDFSNLETGGLELKHQEFNLVELVTKTVDELRYLATQKNLSLVIHTNIQNPIVINDRARLQQVFVNLLDNAIKFTENGGIFVELYELNQDSIVLMVKDTGIGIPETELKNIFREFWQLDQTTTRKYGGTGLGLAIANNIVSLMKGTITVKSRKGEGSTLCVELPRIVNC